MKTTLISLLHELLEETDKINVVGIKVSIMTNTQFLADPKTIGEISNVMGIVNSFIDSPNQTTRENVLKLIERINDKF